MSTTPCCRPSPGTPRHVDDNALRAAVGPIPARRRYGVPAGAYVVRWASVSEPPWPRCCWVIRRHSCLILDEPTNSLDLDSVAQLTAALLAYRGALLVASHDRPFLDEIGLTGELDLDREDELRVR